MNISVASSSSAKTIGMILLISGELVSLMASTKSPSPLGHLHERKAKFGMGQRHVGHRRYDSGCCSRGSSLWRYRLAPAHMGKPQPPCCCPACCHQRRTLLMEPAE
jgi:hypothetical protein